VRSGRGRVHVGKLNRRRGRRGVGHGGTVVTGISAVTIVGTGIGRVSTVSTAAAASATSTATTATAAGWRRIYVRASVRAVGRMRRRCAGPVTAASGRHAAALTASVIVCGQRKRFSYYEKINPLGRRLRQYI